MNSLTKRFSSFVKAISDQPYYRIFALPNESNGKVVSTEEQCIRDILHNPPNKRWAGFGVTGLLERDEHQWEEGIEGSNVTGGKITLLRDGYFEVLCPINIQFQRGWCSPQFAIPNSVKWLYPYVVIEFPVSFMRLVKDIYDKSGIDSGVTIEQYYHNITEYALPEGPPTYPTFGAFIDERGVYEGASPIHSVQQIRNDFIPDHVAYDLVADVYSKFGLGAKAIPAFDENKRFILV
ncbi:MAG: hypothetical protein OXU23_11900 [Candidatus Poribacteria bacterium]|nr:hypothetical protein [Candidatus Poribacteria bacterium]